MPSMSSLIIASHVKDGVEVAREHKLPSSVVDIIQQHHGTSLITYFYQKAKELQPLVNVDEGDYRYPGPRPRTKVAAIVMLSDSVEAASRTLEDPTPQRIQALTNSVITRIFLDDQLSKCDLTLKDLRDISRSFNLILSGIFHHRIDYPGMEFVGEKRRSEHRDKKQSEETKAAQRRLLAKKLGSLLRSLRLPKAGLSVALPRRSGHAFAEPPLQGQGYHHGRAFLFLSRRRFFRDPAGFPGRHRHIRSPGGSTGRGRRQADRPRDRYPSHSRTCFILLGYDHETGQQEARKMRRREQLLLKRLSA